jgi:hypothetical protein
MTEENKDILRYLLDDSYEKYNSHFEAFKPKNSLSSASSDILFSRKLRNQQSSEKNRNISPKYVSGPSIHLQLDQERYFLLFINESLIVKRYLYSDILKKDDNSMK